MDFHEGHRTLDGNALAGDLSTIFTPEMTGAKTTCAGCGSTSALAEGVAYADGPGTVLRCRVCHHVLMRLVRARDALWVELQGIAAIQVITPT